MAFRIVSQMPPVAKSSNVIQQLGTPGLTSGSCVISCDNTDNDACPIMTVRSFIILSVTQPTLLTLWFLGLFVEHIAVDVALDMLRDVANETKNYGMMRTLVLGARRFTAQLPNKLSLCLDLREENWLVGQSQRAEISSTFT
jgi:hypothetical protein